MNERTCWETIRIEGDRVVEKAKQLIHEGNVRRIVVRQHDRSVAEFPLSVGVVGAVISPVLAAIGALAALLTDCSIDIERQSPPPSVAETPDDAPSADAT